jgi:hypothetical protein
MRTLIFRVLASDTLEQYRDHDPDRHQAHLAALDGIREGSGRDRAFRADQLGVHLTSVFVRGRGVSDVIVWTVVDPSTVAIIYLGPVEGV